MEVLSVCSCRLLPKTRLPNSLCSHHIQSTISNCSPKCLNLRKGAVSCASGSELDAKSSSSGRRIGPLSFNRIEVAEPFRGKPGSVSFYGLTHQLVEEGKLESSPFKEGTGSFLWVLAPLAFISSLVLPQFFISNAIESALKDDLLAEILISLSSEVVFYIGVAAFLLVTDHVQRPYLQFSSSGNQGIHWGCDIDSLENAAALQKWLSESGLPPQKMAIDRVDVGERGLVALKNIRKGEKLLFVPPSLVITAESEWSCPEAGEVLKRNFVPDWPLLATYLISEASLMKASRWNNYISALPRQPYSLLYWTRSELDTYLVASQIRERAIERITDVTGTYNDLRLRIFSKYPHLFPEEVFNMETFKWSFGILFSRLVRLPSMDGRVALVPWADMLNHSCEVETFLDYDKSSQGIFFTTDRPYQPGEQVFISYGKKSNGELLLSYGFVPREGANPADSVELSLSLNKSDQCYKEKLEALQKHGLSAPWCFPLQITGWPLELMAYAYLAVSPPNMSGQFEEMAAAASNKTAAKKDIRYQEIEGLALQFILDNCESSISKYTKFLQGSGSIDLDVTSPKQINRKLFLKQLAIDLCTSEQRILFRAQYILRRRLRDMRAGELRALNLFDGFRRLFK